MILAIPSDAPGGLDAAVSEHFGHCAVFTLVDLEGKEAKSVDLLANPDHSEGGCMAPVLRLHDARVEGLVAGGMGMRPLAGFQQVGIQVYFREEATTVREAVDLVIAGKARVFAPAQACGGSGGSGGGCQGH